MKHSEQSPGRREFDGIICFGGLDWWYHNRGHYDLQMMRELSEELPVLYVNSISMRVPKLSEGRMFFKRALRKLRSYCRGLVRVRPNFGVYSPVSIPGKLGAALSRPFAPAMVRRAARKMGMQRPLVWVACPPGARFLDALDPVGILYQRTDRFEAFKGVDPVFIGDCNRILFERADLTLYCSSLLMEEEAELGIRRAFIDHGVDFESFARAGLEPTPPADLVQLQRPRVGFVGGIDAHTFDPELFLEVARRLPEYQFMLVGACSLPDDWCGLPNVHLLGQRPYEQVADYMAASDVLIMPWNQSDWIRACNPIKLKEYLATGRPVVTTDFYELKHYGNLLRIATDAESFAAGIRAAAQDPGDACARREHVRQATWKQRSQSVLEELRSLNLFPKSR